MSTDGAENVDSDPNLPAKFDEKRVQKMYDGFLKRFVEIVDRDLVRETRIKGIQIEDERAVTNFLGCIGYLERLDLELENLDNFANNDLSYYRSNNLNIMYRRIIQYNRIIRALKDDHTYSSVVNRFDEIVWKKGDASVAFLLDGVPYGSGTIWVSNEQLKNVVEHMKDNVRHIILSLWGKVVSGK